MQMLCYGPENHFCRVLEMKHCKTIGIYADFFNMFTSTLKNIFCADNPINYLSLNRHCFPYPTTRTYKERSVPHDVLV